MGSFVKIWTVLLSVLSVRAQAACYYPSKRLAPNDLPCRDDTEHSVCCGQGYACLSNGICQATGEERQGPNSSEFVRGSCTDENWRSSRCPLFCIDEEYDFMDGGNGIRKCIDTDEDVYQCINSRPMALSDCARKKNVLYFPGTPSVLTTIGVAPQTENPTSKTSVSSPAATSDSSSVSSVSTVISTVSITSTTQSLPTTLSRTEITSSERTTSATVQVPVPTNGTIESTDTAPPPDLAPIIGGAVGGTAAIVLAGISGFLLARKRKSSDGNGSTPTLHDTPFRQIQTDSVGFGSPNSGSVAWKPHETEFRQSPAPYLYGLGPPPGVQPAPPHEMPADTGASELPAWCPKQQQG